MTELPVLDYDQRFDNVISARSGTSVNIDVGFTAHPDPTVEWFFNGTPLSASGVQASVRTDPWHTGLSVTNVRPNEAGLYKVKVSNKAGSKTATFTIEVKGMNELYHIRIRPIFVCFWSYVVLAAPCNAAFSYCHHTSSVCSSVVCDTRVL